MQTTVLRDHTDLAGREWCGTRVTVFGLAREGTAVARFLAQRGADVLITDRLDESKLAGRIEELRDLPVQYALGGHPDSVLDADLIFVSPGIPRDIPALVRAGERGTRLSNETELFFDHCPAPIIGITGSSGKTTTTTLVGEILKADGQTTWVGGNIGEPLLGDVERIRTRDCVVLELSSFQLEHLTISPEMGVILNITPNHLDRHGTMERYAQAKEQIVRRQTPGSAAVFGLDDPVTGRLAREYADRNPLNAVAGFSGQRPVERGAYLQGEQIVAAGEAGRRTVCDLGEIRLRGYHNVMNVLAACAISAEAHASIDAMRHVVTCFTGVDHRLETIRVLQGVQFVNDSIATSPERAMAALRAYDEPVVLLAGGRDKHLPWEDWADLVLDRARSVVLFGEASALIAQALGAAFGRLASQTTGVRLTPADIHVAGTLDNAVELAASLAHAGDIVLLSPGGTSYDAYLDFTERGQAFRDLVGALDE